MMTGDTLSEVMDVQKRWLFEVIIITFGFILRAAHARRQDIVEGYLHDINLVSRSAQDMLEIGLGMYLVYLASMQAALSEARACTRFCDVD